MFLVDDIMEDKMTLFNYKNVALWGALVAFNAYGMESDKPYKIIPLDVQNLIMHHIIYNDQLTPREFYKVLLNYAHFFNKTSTKFLKTEIELGRNKKLNKYFLSLALVCAVNGGSQIITELLLKLGADAKVWDWQTRRPVIESTTKTVIKQLLLNYGAIENPRYKYNSSKIIKAVSSGNILLIKELINSGADINAVNEWGDKALPRAALYGNLEIIKELIKAGINVNAKNNNEFTALMWAAHWGYLEIAEELIRSGADFNLKNASHQTALDIAKKEGRTEIVHYLEQIAKK